MPIDESDFFTQKVNTNLLICVPKINTSINKFAYLACEFSVFKEISIDFMSLSPQKFKMPKLHFKSGL